MKKKESKDIITGAGEENIRGKKRQFKKEEHVVMHKRKTTRQRNQAY